MARRPESWESVARALAARMRHQADQCPNGRFDLTSGAFMGAEGDYHDPDQCANECPFCADTVAYRRFLARDAGQPYRPYRTPGNRTGLPRTGRE